MFDESDEMAPGKKEEIGIELMGAAFSSMLRIAHLFGAFSKEQIKWFLLS